MKKIHLWAIAVLAISVIAAIMLAISTGERSPIIAAGSIEIESDLETDARNMADLFIIVYDANSPQPMPFGAIRYRLDQPAEGRFFSFVLTPDNLQRMMPSAPMPQTIRVKARLDRDGRAGPDEPGDLVGEVNDTALGSSGIVLKIATKI